MVGHHLGLRKPRPTAANRRPNGLGPRPTRPKVGMKEQPTAGYWMAGSKEPPKAGYRKVDSSPDGSMRAVPTD